jgi:hypothetical protein
MTLCGYDFFGPDNHWFVNDYDEICYGIEIDGELRNCFGIYISTKFGVRIAHFDADSFVTDPRMHLTSRGIKYEGEPKYQFFSIEATLTSTNAS